MCARFENKIKDAELKAEFKKLKAELEVKKLPLKKNGSAKKRYTQNIKRYTQNIAPTDIISVIIWDSEMNIFREVELKWGIRSAIKTPQGEIIKDVFNSKIETIRNRGTQWFRYMDLSRCIVPMSAFYEWIPVQVHPAKSPKKLPQRIVIDDVPFFFSGGIIGQGIDEESGASVITCEPNNFMQPIHNRMPVLLRIEDAIDFLRAPAEAAIEMSQPLRDEVKMSHTTVTLEKNIPDNPSKKTEPEQGSLF